MFNLQNKWVIGLRVAVKTKPPGKNKNVSTTMSQSHVLDILGKKKHRRAPRIKVHLPHNANDSFITSAQATPDTGAEATVAGLDVLKQIGLDIGNTSSS